ncbi:MAG TPA: flagellar biosynthesis protein FlgJ [Firmicutes bacterium]|jgi:flagellar protein FlgJ|nr:flagellar biosynthesis protein FlgJ [Bacillota bacterium]
MTVNLPSAPYLTGETGKVAAQGVDKQRKEGDKLLEACQEFEAIFWQQILRQMRRSIPKSGLMDGGTGEEIFQDFLDEEYARTLARQGAGSLAYMLYEQLRLGEE